MDGNTKIAIFKGKQIRKTIYNNEWWFSVVDVVQTLIDQSNDYIARKYWNKLAQRLREEESEVVTNCHRLKLMASDGKMRGIAIREELTDEWQRRGAREKREYEIFTPLNNFKFFKRCIILIFYSLKKIKNFIPAIQKI